MKINGNEVHIYNGLQIPKSKKYFNILINYIKEEIITRYKENESLMRKNIRDEDINIFKDKYKANLKRNKDNITIEIDNKCELFKEIYKDSEIQLRKMLLEDYLKYYIITYIKKKNIDLQMNEKLLSFLWIIIKIHSNYNIPLMSL